MEGLLVRDYRVPTHSSLKLIVLGFPVQSHRKFVPYRLFLTFIRPPLPAHRLLSFHNGTLWKRIQAPLSTGLYGCHSTAIMITCSHSEISYLTAKDCQTSSITEQWHWVNTMPTSESNQILHCHLCQHLHRIIISLSLWCSGLDCRDVPNPLDYRQEGRYDLLKHPKGFGITLTVTCGSTPRHPGPRLWGSYRSSRKTKTRKPVYQLSFNQLEYLLTKMLMRHMPMLALGHVRERQCGGVAQCKKYLVYVVHMCTLFPDFVFDSDSFMLLSFICYVSVCLTHEFELWYHSRLYSMITGEGFRVLCHIYFFVAVWFSCHANISFTACVLFPVFPVSFWTFFVSLVFLSCRCD